MKSLICLMGMLLFSYPLLATSEISKDSIKRELIELNNAAYLSGNIHDLIDKYSPSAINCWKGHGRKYLESRLVRIPFPKDTSITLKETSTESTQQVKKQNLEFSTVPTHEAIISSTISYKSRCDSEHYSRPSSAHFYLAIREKEYQIVAPCPAATFIDKLSLKSNIRPLSKVNVDRLYDALSESEKTAFSEQIASKKSRVATLKQLMNKHGATLAEAMLVVDKICAVLD